MCPVYKINDPIGLKFLTRLRVNLSHLREHKFRYNFLDTFNPLCSCSIKIEYTKHYLLAFLSIRLYEKHSLTILQIL